MLHTPHRFYFVIEDGPWPLIQGIASKVVSPVDCWLASGQEVQPLG